MNYNHADNLKYYPISLNIADKRCLVVGGGSVGARKAVTLARCGAAVTVVSLFFSDEFIKKTDSYCEIKAHSEKEHSDSNNKEKIICIQKPYDSTDLNSMFLVIGATDNVDVNRQIADDARQKTILCNIADYPEGSSFVLPSIVQRGELVITVSTSGNSPALAKKLRKELKLQFGQEYATFLVLMGKIRKWLLAQNHSPQTHAAIFRQLVNSELLEHIASNDYSKIEITLNEILGSHRELMLMDNCTLPSYQDFIFGE
ncbi:MAG: bifunctional precorrin-2 dehydrogenase/sirohydrochlorin ferrochelatase [Desulfamplus sp.]|nr:bifunctional precorrin-2 dehydrogenase/sirohydrochlorin ferrochelatase [Desulfamplus sp.]MBF0411689.1 bifunctional precorrin-2 dehydrogenase/sirohydrochlorin ferrochelatase [Desulfamplus sp.]